MFQPLSQPLLEHYYGRHVASKAPPALLAELSHFREHVDESIVVLSQARATSLLLCFRVFPRSTRVLSQARAILLFIPPNP